MPGLGSALGVSGIPPIGRQFLLTAPVGMEPAFVVMPAGRLFRRKPVVADEHQFDVVEAHIGAIPVIAIVRG